MHRQHLPMPLPHPPPIGEDSSCQESGCLRLGKKAIVTRKSCRLMTRGDRASNGNQRYLTGSSYGMMTRKDKKS